MQSINKYRSALVIFIAVSLAGIKENYLSAQTYCSPVFSSGCSLDYINKFSFHTLSKQNSGCNGDAVGYSYDAVTTTSVEKGGAYPISMQSGQQYGQGFGVWIDYNIDGDFADAGEFVYGSPTSSTEVFNAFISIPETAATGQTRLRVRCVYSATLSDLDSCSTLGYGETEDYNITITQPPSCTSPPTAGTATASTTYLCAGNTTFYLSLTGCPNRIGQTYQWQESPNGTNWTNIANGTSKAISYSITQTAWFRCVVTCGGFSISTPIEVKVGMPLSVSFSSIDVTCYGQANGSVTATVTGGIGPYTYSWSSQGSGCKADELKKKQRGNYAALKTIPSAMADTFPNSPTINNLPSNSYNLTITDSKGCTVSGSQYVNQPSQLWLSTSSLNTACAASNGAASVSVSGGNWPYIYSWQGGQSNDTITALTSGVYSVTVTDINGCTATANVGVSDNGAPVLTFTVTNLSCHNGNSGVITVNTFGGTPPFNYAWNTTPVKTTATITGLSAGTYYATVTDPAGCKAIKDTTIYQPSPLETGVNNYSVTCRGVCNGSLYTNVSGGTWPYTYLWHNGNTDYFVDSLCAGNYSVTITDANGCTLAETNTVQEPGALVASSTQTMSACFGACNGVILASATGGKSPYSYNWSTPNGTDTIAPGLCAGNYSVIVTDSDTCGAKDTVFAAITQPNVLAVSIPLTDSTSCFGSKDGTASVSPSGGTTPYSYAWSSGATSSAAGNLSAGQHSVTVTDSKGCSTTTTVTIAQPTAITATLTAGNASCYGTCTGSATVMPAGGTGPYSYAWFPMAQTTQSASYLCAGVQTVFVYDSKNCVFSDTVSVAQPLAVPVTASATPTSCGLFSGTATASVSGPGAVPPFYILWTTGDTGSTVNGLDAGIYRANVTDGNGCFGFADALVTSSNGPSIGTGTVTPVSCFGGNNGSIDISVSGGATPYTYEWSSGQVTQDIFGVSYGPYEVVVTDATGCLVTKSFFVGQPASLSILSSVINSGCAATNGSASVTVSGGNVPYTYQWSNGGITTAITGIGSGLYNVIVSDAKGCADTALIAVQDSGGPVVFVDTIAAASCGNAGFILLAPQDSAAIAAYQWNTGSTTQNLANANSGNYGVVITDTSGCKSVLVTPVNIVLPPLKPICVVTVDTLSNQNIVVWEKPVSSYIAGFNIYRESSQQGIYQKVAYTPYSNVSTYYDPIADPEVKWARYRISIVDICGIEGPASPDHKTIHLAIQSFNNDSTLLVWDAYGGYPFTVYDIYRKDSLAGNWNMIASVPATTTNYLDTSFPKTGGVISYHVDVDHPGGDCMATIKYPDPQATSVKSSKSNSSERTVGLTSINEFSADQGVSIYPNPNSGVFYVEFKNLRASEVRVFNVLGEEVKQINNISQKNKIEVDVRNFPSGVYYVRTRSDRSVITQKVIVR